MKRAPREGLASGERDTVSTDERIVAAGQLSRILGLRGNTLQVAEAAGLGARNSGHDVFFVGDGRGAEFAVKRFRRGDAAMKELNAIHEVGRRGFRTFEPAGSGVYHLENFGSALVTERMPGLRSGDQIDWRNAKVGQPGYEHYAASLNDMAKYVGALHAAGVAHGDLQVKNLGSTPAGYVAFDLEGVNFSDDPGTDFMFQGYCVEDVAKFVTSLAGRGFLSNVSPELFKDELTDKVLMPYWEKNPAAGEPVADQWDMILAGAEQARAESRGSQAPDVASAAGYVALQNQVTGLPGAA